MARRDARRRQWDHFKGSLKLGIEVETRHNAYVSFVVQLDTACAILKDSETLKMVSRVQDILPSSELGRINGGQPSDGIPQGREQ